MQIIQKEIIIFISALLLCLIAHLLDSYNTLIIYLLVRIWVNDVFKGES